jgi:hypothetical protein
VVTLLNAIAIVAAVVGAGAIVVFLFSRDE